ncbi:hypothetical protein [Mycobacterium sp. NPDC006124]|uniref:hypothetical protein n=1 Tax=Mycobacterium sp. NPDC006124 TaxID=3156729 RepID=UPI0033BBAFE6
MKRRAGTLAAMSATMLTLGVLTPTAESAAATNTATRGIAIDDTHTVQIHVTANCVKAENRCYFDTLADVLTPDGTTGFPSDFYGKQNTTIRSTNRLVYMDADFDAANTRMFKSISDTEFATVYFAGNPPVMRGDARTVQIETGQPNTDAGFIACAYIQVVYGGINLTTPTACAQTTYS